MLPPVNRRDSGSRQVVIMGCGQLGASIAAALSEEGHILHILDTDPGAFQLLPGGLLDEGHIVPVVGDGTVEADLRKASTQEADVFVAVAGSDSCNALAAQLARHVLQVPAVVCRIDDPTSKEMYSQLELIAISSTELVTAMVMNTTVR